MDRIKEILKKCGVSVYRLTYTLTEAAELYLIKKKLDMPRLKKIGTIKAEIFRDFEEEGKKYRGSALIYLEQGLTDEEMEQKIKNAYFAASFVKNPFYELPAPCVSDLVPSTSDYRDMPLEEAAGKVADLFLSVESDEKAFINSAEIFVRRSAVRILDSAGTDVSYMRDVLRGEFVAQCREPEDVEQYRQFSYTDLDLKSLGEKLQDAVRDVRLRAAAVKAPKAGTCSVILTGENLRELLKFYMERSESAMVYPGYSTWKKGDNVQGETEGGEKLNLTLSSALPFSSEGIPMKDRPLLQDGVLAAIHGGSRFAFYLGIEPTGSYEKVLLDAGTMPLEEMKKSGALETVSFSDFQTDVMDGHFAGEIRLALARGKDGEIIPLTGGSVNGSLLASQGKLIFSRERYKDAFYEGPLAVLIPDVRVAGVS